MPKFGSKVRSSEPFSHFSCLCHNVRHTYLSALWQSLFAMIKTRSQHESCKAIFDFEASDGQEISRLRRQVNLMLATPEERFRMYIGYLLPSDFVIGSV